MSDYISRDVAIIEFMDNDIDHIQAPNGKEAVQILSDIPAADVVPVVHASWMPQKGGGLCCSECGGYALDEADGNFIHVAVPSKFCPNCGAKMNGEKRK